MSCDNNAQLVFANQVDFLTFHLTTVTASTTFPIVHNLPFAATISTVTVVSRTGGTTFTLLKNGTSLSTQLTSQTINTATNNTFTPLAAVGWAAGDYLSISIGTPSTAVNVIVTINYIRI